MKPAERKPKNPVPTAEGSNSGVSTFLTPTPPDHPLTGDRADHRVLNEIRKVLEIEGLIPQPKARSDCGKKGGAKRYARIEDSRRISTRNLTGCDPLGYVPLRRAVAEYLSRSRGVRCVPEQVAIVSGVQEALDLIARTLLNLEHFHK